MPQMTRSILKFTKCQQYSTHCDAINDYRAVGNYQQIAKYCWLFSGIMQRSVIWYELLKSCGTVDGARYQLQLLDFNNAIHLKHPEYMNRLHKVIFRHFEQERSEKWWRRRIGNHWYMWFTYQTFAIRLSFVCIDVPRTFRAALQFSRRSQKLA